MNFLFQNSYVAVSGIHRVILRIITQRLYSSDLVS